MITLNRAQRLSPSRGTATGQRSVATVVLLAAVIAALATVSATIGLFSQGGTGASTVTSVRGARVTLFGHGVYRRPGLPCSG